MPGHIDFIKNMLAGVGGIDAALFVVAADEGVMPQTREHLAILDLLQVPAGVVALTKMDTVTEEGWLDLVEADLREVLRGTCLADAPIVPVSARTGAGLAPLKQALADALAGVPPRRDKGQPRLPIDRVFTMAGFGTVVTGTLSDGQFRVGDEVEILPGGLQGAHPRPADPQEGGRGRAAGQPAGDQPDRRAPRRAAPRQVVTRPGSLQPTTLVDVRLRLVRGRRPAQAPPAPQPAGGLLQRRGRGAGAACACWTPSRFPPAAPAGRSCGSKRRWRWRQATASSSARRRRA